MGTQHQCSGIYEHPHLLLPRARNETSQTPVLLSGTISNHSTRTDKVKVFLGKAAPWASTAPTQNIFQPIFTSHWEGVVSPAAISSSKLQPGILS